MAGLIPRGRTGESKNKGQVTIYHRGASEYMGSPVWTDKEGRRHVGARPKQSGRGRGGGGGGGY